MRIEKGVTENFDSYSVLLISELPKPWYIPRAWWVDKKIETELKFVEEADAVTGLVIRQIANEWGEPIFSNGTEDIKLTNEVKLMLLVPIFREAFLLHGFQPKTITTYETGLKIINKNPVASIALTLQDLAEVGELEST